VRAVVTGGAGFIGSTLVDELLARGDEVHVVDDLSAGKREQVAPAATLHVIDIRDPFADALADVRPEVVFHLAAQVDVRASVANPVDDARANVLGTVNVLELAARSGAQVVLASTGGAIYGESDRPLREDDPRRPLSPYGTSKLAAEEYLAAWNRLHGAGHVSLRLGNVYGPRQDPRGEAGVVAIFLARLHHGGAPTIFGDGTQTRDYVFVGDVVRAFVAAVGRDGGVFNVATGVETSVLDLWAACREATDAGIEATHEPPRLGELARSCLDPSRAAQELGWRAEVPLAEGLRRTWAWIREE
jgi:UDP-glucose 4-epimerase